MLLSARCGPSNPFLAPQKISYIQCSGCFHAIVWRWNLRSHQESLFPGCTDSAAGISD